MHVGPVPTGEGVVNRSRQLSEGMSRGGGKDTSGSWPRAFGSPVYQVNPYRQPNRFRAEVVRALQGLSFC
jgi:hypothetical protein